MTLNEIYKIADKLVAKMKSYEGHNVYSQTRRNNVVSIGTGSGDCSSTVATAYKAVLGVNIGSNTVSQFWDSDLVTVPLKITNGIPEEKYMLPGDLLYFRGRDKSRKSAGYVGHVEMYVGNGQLSGHGGPGKGPTRKDMVAYCRSRQNSKSPNVSPSNRGLICVRRSVLLASPTDSKAIPTDNTIKKNYFPKYNGKSSSIIEALNTIGVNSSMANRKKIATANLISNYRGTTQQNILMVNLVKAGKLIKP